MSSSLAATVDPRVHALRTLAQFLTRHGPVRPTEDPQRVPGSDADEAGSVELPEACDSAPSPFDPLVRRPGGDEDELPCALSA